MSGPVRVLPDASDSVLLHLRMLGPGEVLWQGAPCPIPRRQTRALLWRLGSDLQPVARDDLAFLFWPDERQSVARRNLTHLLTHLRRALPQSSLLVLTHDVVGLDPCQVWSDTETFRRLCATPAGPDRARAWQQASNLYAGPFLHGLATPESPEYEAWLAHERDALHNAYHTVVSASLDQCIAAGDCDPGIDAARRFLALDETCEDVHRALMILYARSGNRDAALRQFERLTDVLARELGTNPLDTTRAVYDAILHGHLDHLGSIGVTPRWSTMRGIEIPLLGRDEALRQLQQAFGRAQGRQGSIIWIMGEPGIGKTRLMHEFANALRGQAFVLIGGVQPCERALPYQVVSEALRSLPDLPALVGQLAPVWRQQAARLLPELATGPWVTPAPETSDSAEARLNLFNALSQIVLFLAEIQPVVLCLDDLHCADTASLDWLVYLGRRLIGSRTLVLATVLSEESAGLYPLSHQLARAGVLTHMTLGALDVALVQQLVEAVTGALVTDEAAIERLHRATGGNPFFLLEAVRALVEVQAWPPPSPTHPLRVPIDLPETVCQAVEMRLQRLTPLARQVLEASAVIGHSIRRDVLLVTAGRHEIEIYNAIEELLARQLLSEQEGEYRFQHDMVRGVVYQHLSAGRRIVLHRRAAEALAKIFAAEFGGPVTSDRRGTAMERRPHSNHGPTEDELIASLAAHYLAAGEHAQAVTHLLWMGDRARRLYAHQAAIEAYEQALRLLDRLDDYEQSARALMKLALTYHGAFQFDRARGAYERGFALWQRAMSLPPAAVPHRTATLRVNWSEPTALDPAHVWEFYTSGTADLLFRGLLERTPDLGVVPAVAQAWDVRDGGLTYVFHLRDDIVWSDGHPLTAGDFEHAWKRVLQSFARSPYSGLSFDDIKGAAAYRQGPLSNTDQVGVHALDDCTLVVELERPTSYFLQLMACSAWYPVPRHVVQKFSPLWLNAEHFVSNGPFRLADWQPGQRLDLVRNARYFGRFAGNVTRVELALGLDHQANQAAYENDQLDVLNLEGTPPGFHAQARLRHPDDYVSFPMLRTWMLQFDASRPPFDDPLLRRALALALDRTFLADVIQRGNVFPAHGGFIPPGMPAHSPGIALPFDLHAARGALAAAGYPGGRGMPPQVGVSQAGMEPLCQYAQRQWRNELGVQVEWDIVSAGLMVDRLVTQRPAMRITSWAADFPDPDNFLAEVIFRRVFGGWSHPQYRALVEEARSTPQQERRIGLYQAAEKILIEEAALVPLLYARHALLLKPWVKHFPTSPLEWWFWQDVVIER